MSAAHALHMRPGMSNIASSRGRVSAKVMTSFAGWGTLAMVAACSTTPVEDVTVTGPVHRFVVDGFRLPETNVDIRELGVDLDGDRAIDNMLGAVTTALATYDNLDRNAAALIASGLLRSSVEIQADDLSTDDTVLVRYFGEEGAYAKGILGRFERGVFEPATPPGTLGTGAAIVRLPVLADAEPATFELEGMRIRLVPDGAGGYDAFVQGVVRIDVARDAAYPGIVQMLTARPQEHRTFWYLADANHDGTVTRDELDTGMLRLLLAPDLDVTLDGERASVMSVGFALHLSPCAEGACEVPAITDHCVDRVLDGDETDIDCGGSCGACPGGATCASDDDCQTGRCDGGVCAAATCDDGLLDGFESDVDCGGGCAACGAGKRCEFDVDCASGTCDTSGVCR
jgi:hypothetical protein